MYHRTREVALQFGARFLERAWKRAEAEVYELTRRSSYLGGWISHSGWYPDRQRRLCRRSAARFCGIVHESLRFEGRPGRLAGDLYHYTIRTLAEHEEKVDRYSTVAARQMYAEGNDGGAPGVSWRRPGAGSGATSSGGASSTGTAGF